MGGGSLLIALCSHLSFTKISNPVLGAELNMLASVALIALLWYLVLHKDLETPAGAVRLLWTRESLLLLAGLVAATGLVGYAELQLVGAGLSAAAVGSYANCAWFCFLLVGILIYIYRKTSKRRVLIKKEA